MYYIVNFNSDLSVIGVFYSKIQTRPLILHLSIKQIIYQFIRNN